MLRPGASVEAVLSFIAQRDGSQIRIEYRDPARAEPILVDLGRADQAPGIAHGGHGH